VRVGQEVHLSICSRASLTFCQSVSRVSRLREWSGERKRLGAGRTVRGGDGGMDMCQATACLCTPRASAECLRKTREQL